MIFYSQFLKRLIDFTVAILVLIVASPILMIVAVCLHFANSGSPFFLQARPGRHSKVFKIIKFKTMNDKRDKDGKLLPDADRLTPLGRVIRSTSLDELPQLINVIKGDMSLIGPRPLLISYLKFYTQEQAWRQEVRPGITGWTQVNGRNSISWEKKFELDVWYVQNLSFSLDMKILWMTIIKVFKREGINAANATTMKPFTGNN